MISVTFENLEPMATTQPETEENPETFLKIDCSNSGPKATSLVSGVAYIFEKNYEGQTKPQKISVEAIEVLKNPSWKKDNNLRKIIYHDPAIMLSKKYVSDKINFSTLPLLENHDPNKRVGNILHGSVEPNSNYLQITAEITDRSFVNNIKNKKLLTKQAFSIGYDVEMKDLSVIGYKVNEISIVDEPFFKNCNVKVFASKNAMPDGKNPTTDMEIELDAESKNPEKKSDDLTVVAGADDFENEKIKTNDKIKKKENLTAPQNSIKENPKEFFTDNEFREPSNMNQKTGQESADKSHQEAALSQNSNATDNGQKSSEKNEEEDYAEMKEELARLRNFMETNKSMVEQIREQRTKSAETISDKIFKDFDPEVKDSLKQMLLATYETPGYEKMSAALDKLSSGVGGKMEIDDSADPELKNISNKEQTKPTSVEKNQVGNESENLTDSERPNMQNYGRTDGNANARMEQNNSFQNGGRQNSGGNRTIGGMVASTLLKNARSAQKTGTDRWTNENQSERSNKQARFNSECTRTVNDDNRIDATQQGSYGAEMETSAPIMVSAMLSPVVDAMYSDTLKSKSKERLPNIIDISASRILPILDDIKDEDLKFFRNPASYGMMVVFDNSIEKNGIQITASNNPSQFSNSVSNLKTQEIDRLKNHPFFQSNNDYESEQLLHLLCMLNNTAEKMIGGERV